MTGITTTVHTVQYGSVACGSRAGTTTGFLVLAWPDYALQSGPVRDDVRPGEGGRAPIQRIQSSIDEGEKEREGAGRWHPAWGGRASAKSFMGCSCRGNKMTPAIISFVELLETASSSAHHPFPKGSFFCPSFVYCTVLAYGTVQTVQYSRHSVTTGDGSARAWSCVCVYSVHTVDGTKSAKPAAVRMRRHLILLE